MKRTRITTLLTAAALTVPTALAVSTAPAAGAPMGEVFGTSLEVATGSLDSATGSLDSGSSALGSSGDTVKHYGKLGRPDARNGVRSINVWVYTPNRTAAIAPGVYPKNSRLGVRWNSIIASGPIIDGDECRMTVRLSGPKVPKEAEVYSTRDCTAVKSYHFRGAGQYKISVTDNISGASNNITFAVR